MRPRRLRSRCGPSQTDTSQPSSVEASGTVSASRESESVESGHCGLLIIALLVFGQWYVADRLEQPPVRRPDGNGVRQRRGDPGAAPDRVHQPHVSHQATDAASSHSMPSRRSCFQTFRGPYTWKCSSRRDESPRAARHPDEPGSIAGRHRVAAFDGGHTSLGDRQRSADRLDPVHVTQLTDERDHHITRRSSSACPTSADALTENLIGALQLSILSLEFLGPACRSSVVRSGRRPSSRSALSSQCRRVSAVQPIFSATNRIADHCDSFSLSSSKTGRTAHSRTSGQYRLCRAMGVSEMCPPTKPVRFKPTVERYQSAGAQYRLRQLPAVVFHDISSHTGLLPCLRRA